MNRLLVVILGVAIIALAVFGFIVFTGPPPAPLMPERTEQAAATPTGTTPASDSNVGPAASPATTVPVTAEATARFDAWAKPLRDAGLTVTADRVAEAGETMSVTGLTLEEPSAPLAWRWTIERASLYDRELFHFQTAGATTFAVTTAPGVQLTWSGKADAIGVAVQRDMRDALSRSLVVRMNGISVAQAGDAAPVTLSDGQLRILLKGGTGLMAPGTDMALRLTDLVLPGAAGSALGTAVKSFTTEFAIDRSITQYSLQQMVDFFTRGAAADVKLGTIAVDWGALHFTGKGTFGLSPSGEPRARLEVNVRDALTLLDAISAANGTADDALVAEYAALLQEIGQNPDQPALPMIISLKDGTIVLEGRTGDIKLSGLPQSADGTPVVAPAAP